VTIDTTSCQKTIAEHIIQAQADYVLTLKDNRPQLCDDASLWLSTEADKGSPEVHETVDKDHDRLEIRRYRLSRDIDGLLQKPEWLGLQAVGRVASIRFIGDKTTTERRYYLTLLTGLSRSPKQYAAIEPSRIASTGCLKCNLVKNHSPANLALIRRMALNVIRHNGPSKHSLRLRKMRASINDDYRFELIFCKEPT